MDTNIISKLNKSHVPIVTINKNLEVYKDRILFKEKVEDANNVLRVVGLPDVKHKVAYA
jgi:hypothetical protein